MKEADFDQYITEFADVTVDQTLDDHVTAYRVSADERRDIFALKESDIQPLRLHLKCDRILLKKLRTEYETVSPSPLMNSRDWNQVVCTGQLDDDEIKDLIRHSYLMVARA